MELRIYVCIRKKRRNIIMDTLRGAVIVAAAAFMVLALCAGVKAVCRRLLEKI